jgi:hypothetical protein
MGIQVASLFTTPSEGSLFLTNMKKRVVTDESAEILLDLKVAELSLISNVK